MAIEFVCSACQSKHAYAEHMAGKQFRCGGCGKILTVPAPGGEAITAQAPRHAPAPADEPDSGERDAGVMGSGLQATLLIVGSVVLVVVLLACLGGGAMFLWVGARVEEQDVMPPANVIEAPEMKAQAEPLAPEPGDAAKGEAPK
jgi:hypothetical protein